jgi:hypothetical protein
MQLRQPVITALALLSFVAAACGGDDGSSQRSDSTEQRSRDGDRDETDEATDDEVTGFDELGPLAPPAHVDVLRTASRLPDALDSLGFLPDWPAPQDGHTITGVYVSRSIGPDYVAATTRTVYDGESGELADIVTTWEQKINDLYDVGGTGLVTGHLDNDEIEAAVGSAGLDEATGAGEFELEAIRRIGATGPAAILVENERELPGADLKFTLPPELASAVPGTDSCTPTFALVSYDAYDAPSDFAAEPTYQIRVEYRCDAATIDGVFESYVDWVTAKGRDPGRAETKFAQGGIPGPAGFTIDVNAYRDDDGGLIALSFDQPLT